MVPVWGYIRWADPGWLFAKADALRAPARRWTQAFARSRETSFRHWARQALVGGAGTAHKWTKGPQGFLDDHLEGGRPLGMQQTADWLSQQWQQDVWNICEEAGSFTQQELDPHWLPPPEPGELRPAAETFPRRTGLG